MLCKSDISTVLTQMDSVIGMTLPKGHEHKKSKKFK